MKIQIEIDLPENLLKTTAGAAAEALFRRPDYGNPGSPGYVLIAEAAKKAVAEIDFAPFVKAEIARLTPDVVQDVVGAALRAMVKAQVKALKESGDLLT
jgi:protein tyrosine phosphatase (PTP) superfamily phosphohydrolase (DUF442 family)